MFNPDDPVATGDEQQYQDRLDAVTARIHMYFFAIPGSPNGRLSTIDDEGEEGALYFPTFAGKSMCSFTTTIVGVNLLCCAPLTDLRNEIKHLHK
jgi:hypothetical protein